MNENAIKFSIAIPAYKAKFLHDAIDSCLAQSYENFELIIVDDCSPENLFSIVNQFNDARIRYYRNEKNCGAAHVYANWNICLSYCTGDFVICMGDDDCLLANCLTDYVDLISKYPDLDVYHAMTEIIDENGNLKFIQEIRPERESVYSMMWHRMNGREQYIGDFLFRVSRLKENGGFFENPYAYISDEVSSYIAAGDKGIANLCKPAFQYRINSLTISNNFHALELLGAASEGKCWFCNFLEKKPNDNLDKVYYELIKGNLDKHFKKRHDYIITRDMDSSKSGRLLYWVMHKNGNAFSYLFRLWACTMMNKILRKVRP